MMSAKSAIVCNMSCTCPNVDCEYGHYLYYKNRKIVAKLLERNPLILANKLETNPELRKANCRFGFLCENENCNYRHRLNPTGRNTLITLYKNKIDEKEKPKFQKPVVVKDNSIKTENKFLFLEEEMEEVSRVNDVKPVLKVIFPKFKISYANMAKKANDIPSLEKQEEISKDLFEKMMKLEVKNWGDYDDEEEMDWSRFA
jgi:hypothetical protein